MPKAKVNDISMYYEIHGEGEPLVLISGFGADHTTWLPTLEIFKKHYQVVLFDNRGAGRTDVPVGPYSVEQMADDLAALCEHLKIRKANFVGSSMGGYILQSLAYRHPELVKAAVIMNASFMRKSCFHLYVGSHLEFIKAKAPRVALIKAMCAWVFSFQFLEKPGVLERLIQLNLDNPYPFTITGFEAQFEGLANFDSSAWLAQIKCPTLVMGADLDNVFNEAAVKKLAEKIPGAIYFGFENCGHLPQIEYPELFAHQVIRFLEKK